MRNRRERILHSDAVVFDMSVVTYNWESEVE